MLGCTPRRSGHFAVRVLSLITSQTQHKITPRFYVGISTTLHDEIAPLGLRSTCIDFGYFRTEFLNADHRAPQISRIADYQPMTSRANAALEGMYPLPRASFVFTKYEVFLQRIMGNSQVTR